MVKIFLLICLIQSISIHASVGQSGHVGAADRECLACHFSAPDVTGHPGTDGTGCTYCHHWTIVGNDIESIMTPDNADCVGCHVNSETYRVNSAHEAYPCTTCHIPHGSNQDHLLIGSANTLCTTGCHLPELLGQSHPRGSGTIDTHTGAELTCISTCHSIHTTGPEHLLTLAPPYLCASCHSDKL